ncbi:MAG: hypothetical protein WA055_01280 [Candidatus Moraniibacteriota bacterium]
MVSICIPLYFVISKISILEGIENDSIERNREVVHGKRACRICRHWFDILWPQRGGICDDCLFDNYSLKEAKSGLCGCHHFKVEETYRQHKMMALHKKLP